MPKPVYIFCAQNALEDKETGLLSVFQLVDKFQTTSVPPPPNPGQHIIVTWPGLAVIHAWLAEPGDTVGDEYEDEVRFVLADNNVIELGRAVFKIGHPDPAKPLYRIIVRFQFPPQVGVPGMMFVESRIRKIGTEDWICQRSPILVEVLPPPPLPTNGQSQQPPSSPSL